MYTNTKASSHSIRIDLLGYLKHRDNQGSKGGYVIANPCCIERMGPVSGNITNHHDSRCLPYALVNFISKEPAYGYIIIVSELRAVKLEVPDLLSTS